MCHDVCHEPLITNVCHHSFCTACIFQALEQGESSCPLCRRHLNDRGANILYGLSFSNTFADLHPNLALSSLIGELLVYCCYRPFGCTAQVRLDAKHSHEKTCTFAPARCPNFVHGCDYESSEAHVLDHLRDCIFQKLRGYIERNERQVQAMKETIQSLSKEMEELREQVRLGRPSDGVVSPTAVALPPAAAAAPRSSWPDGDLTCQYTLSESSGVTSLAVRDDDVLFCGGYDGSTKVWDLHGHRQLSTYVGHKSSVWSLVLDRARSRLYSSSSDGTVKVWSTQPDQEACLQTLTAHRGRVYSLLLHGGRLVSASSDRTIRVWDLDSLECIQTLTGHTDGINTLSVQADGSLVSGANDSTIRVRIMGILLGIG